MRNFRAVVLLVLAGTLFLLPTSAVAQLGGVAAQVARAQRTKHCQAEADRFSIPWEKREIFLNECRGLSEIEAKTDNEGWWFDVFGYAFAAFLLFGWGYSLGRGRKYAAVLKDRRSRRGG